MSRPGRRSRSRSRSRSPDSGMRGRRRDDRPWQGSRSVSKSRSRSRSPRNRGRRSRSPFKRPVMSKEPKFMSSRVFVANLASDQTSDAELHDLFSKYGKVIDTLVHHNGYGFVQFNTEEEGRVAVAAVNGLMFHAKKLKCNMAAEGGKRGGSAGNGGGGIGRGGGIGGPSGPSGPPPGDRFGREHSPGPDRYGPPFENPYMRGRDLPPPPRDLAPPPARDPYFDDPYRRPLPPDPYFDRLRDDPYRRDPYDPPYADRYREMYGRNMIDPAPLAQKPVAVDCEIIIMSSDLRPYADMVERRLKNMNLLTGVSVIREDYTVPQQVEDCARRSCLFVIIINSQNEIHRSLTLNILHGVAQEHRNMPLDDALSLVARSFEQYLRAEKEKLSQSSTAQESKRGSGSMDLHMTAKDMAYLFNLLADSRPVTLEEMDKVIVYLQNRKDKMLAAVGLASTPASATAAVVQNSALSQPLQYPPHLTNQQLQQQLLQQQQQQQQQKQHKELESKILSMMNGTAASSVSQQSLMQTSVSPVMPASISALGGVSGLASVTSPSSVVGVKAPAAPTATLINFDNPTVQKALDNLIQSGPSLLKNITTTKTPLYSSTNPSRPKY